MVDPELSHGRLLAEARQRGQEALGGSVMPPGGEHITAYIGLVANAIELGKLLATEERDLQVIANHHEIEMAKIADAFKQVEAAMRADFERESSLRQQAFASIDKLIAAGQYEVATRFYEILMSGFSRPALETILAHRNELASNTQTRMYLK